MTDVAKRTEQLKAIQRRQSTRESVDLPTSISMPGRPPQPVRIVDISPFGLHARFHERSFHRGEQLQIDLPVVGTVKAQVMWGLKGCFGCKFSLPIDALTFLQVLAAVRAGGEDWKR